MDREYTHVVTELLRSCRRSPRRQRVVDSTGARLTGASLIVRSLILRRLLLREILGDDEQVVGVLLPPSAGGALANFALTFCHRIAVNLNYTLRPAQIDSCIRRAGIQRVLTSRRFLERTKLEVDAELIPLESLVDKVTWRDKLAAAFWGLAVPERLLERRLGLDAIQPDDLLTIIFTSGSTGEPKGVMLSHRNVGSNIAAINQVLRLRPDDQVLGVLPFFHAFGYTVALWGALCLDCGVAYHHNPLEAATVGRLCQKERVTIAVGAPTMLRGFWKRCEPDDFRTLEVCVSGAERLPPELADAFEAKFGVRPVEGYGATELSPVAAVNVPPGRAPAGAPEGNKPGTVGRPIPGVEARVIDPDSGAVLPPNVAGLLEIRGPNVMQGYLARPDLTEKVLHDGWYSTGDMARIDEEGFLTITGRQSRFSKIGGEMVPHVAVEEAIARVVQADPDQVVVAVTAIADPRKGERLLVVHRPLGRPAQDICRALQAEGLPPLWIPSPDSFIEVETIPLLGTGKVDLKAVERLAAESRARA